MSATPCSPHHAPDCRQQHQGRRETRDGEQEIQASSGEEFFCRRADTRSFFLGRCQEVLQLSAEELEATRCILTMAAPILLQFGQGLLEFGLLGCREGFIDLRYGPIERVQALFVDV